MPELIQLIPQENKDPNSTDVEYKAVNLTIKRKVVKDSGWTGFTFLELDDDGQGGKICGITPQMAKKNQATLQQCNENTQVQVTLVDTADGYRNVAKITLLDIGGDSVESNQSTQETQPKVINIPQVRAPQKVLASWESGVEYNDRKDSKICLNVAAAESVKLFGHISALTSKAELESRQTNSEWMTELSKQYKESYRLAVSMIIKLSNLSDTHEEDIEQ